MLVKLLLKRMVPAVLLLGHLVIFNYLALVLKISLILATERIA
ncbi:hypothetical protein M902_2625 [Bacteriovorax sp. BAL6_X]|nr:hypothetical protein M902_2625 [Bacteriovorax sp. BAL6_X]